MFLWNRRDFEILAISLNEGVVDYYASLFLYSIRKLFLSSPALSPENERIQTFLLTDTPLFEVSCASLPD